MILERGLSAAILHLVGIDMPRNFEGSSVLTLLHSLLDVCTDEVHLKCSDQAPNTDAVVLNHVYTYMLCTAHMIPDTFQSILYSKQ